ncbi:MAG: STAS domain-containing protein [Phycisphaerales bacterium]
MFGKFRRQPGQPIPVKSAGPRPRLRLRTDFGFDPDKGPSRSMATYDRLGMTLVATPVVGTLSGPDAAALARELVRQIEEAAADEETPAGVRHVVLDLQNVQYMDSMCVGVLVELLTTLKEAGGRIALVNASTNIEYLFKLTRLDRVFPICRDVMKAIEVVEREG